jgi:hypothetical protein
MKHREIDAQRRQRESAVVSRLHHLNAWKVEGGDDGEEEFDEKKDKVSILEQSAAKLAELQDLVTHLSRTCTLQQENITKLSLHLREVGTQLQLEAGEDDPSSSSSSSSVLSHLPRRTAEFLTSFDRSHALYRSCILSASMCIFLVSVETGRLLEANEVMYAMTGWRPEEIIDRVITAPYDKFTAHHPPDEPILQNPLRPLVLGPSGQLVPARTFSQYPRSKALMKELLTGKQQSITCTWRTQLRDGHIYEVQSMSWVGRREKITNSAGEVELRPMHLVFATSPGNALIME